MHLYHCARVINFYSCQHTDESRAIELTSHTPGAVVLFRCIHLVIAGRQLQALLWNHPAREVLPNTPGMLTSLLSGEVECQIVCLAGVKCRLVCLSEVKCRIVSLAEVKCQPVCLAEVKCRLVCLAEVKYRLVSLLQLVLSYCYLNLFFYFL